MTSLTLVRRIKAQPAIVFAALTTAEGITHWWGPDAGPVLLAESDARVGGRFRVRFRKIDGSDMKPAASTWRSRIADAIDVGTELTFTHARLQTEVSRASHGAGWSYALDELVGYLSSGSPVVAQGKARRLA